MYLLYWLHSAGTMYVCMRRQLSVWCTRLARLVGSFVSCDIYTYCTSYTRPVPCTYVYMYIWEVSLVCSSGLTWPGLAWLVSSFMSYDIYLLYRHVILQNRRQCTLYCTADIWRQLSAAHITTVTHTIMCTITYTLRYHSGGYIAGCLALRRIKLCLNCLQPLGKGFLVG